MTWGHSGNVSWQLVIANPAVARLLKVSLRVGFPNILASYLLKKGEGILRCGW